MLFEMIQRSDPTATAPIMLIERHVQWSLFVERDDASWKVSTVLLLCKSLRKNKRRTFFWSIRPPNLPGGVTTLSNTTILLTRI